jgi:hypothetical protein
VATSGLRTLRSRADPLADLHARLEEAELRARLGSERADMQAARFARLPEKHRPYFTPAQRFRILEMRTLLAWNLQETADAFLVYPNTILNWEKAADPLTRTCYPASWHAPAGGSPHARSDATARKGRCRRPPSPSRPGPLDAFSRLPLKGRSVAQ